MAISDAEYLDWLSRPDVPRVVLVEAQHYAGTVRVANVAWGEARAQCDGDDLFYEPILLRAPTISLRADGQTSVGDILVGNDGGQIDDWLDLHWEGHPITVLIGDPAWTLADFRPAVAGRILALEAPDGATLRWRIADAGADLERPVQPVLMADGNPVPLCWGQVFNVEPRLLQSTPALKYQVHSGACTLSNPRINGSAYTGGWTDHGDGTFTMGSTPAGKLTIDVATTTDTVAEIVADVCSRLGVAVNAASLASFPNAAPQGYYARDPITGAAMLGQILAGVGGAPFFNSVGELCLARLSAPTGSPAWELEADHISDKGLRIDETQPPVRLVAVRYKRNWGSADAGQLSTGLSAADRRLYSEPWATVTASNTPTEYPSPPDLDEVESYFAVQADAQTEANRLAALRSVRRPRGEVEVFGMAAVIQPGDLIRITWPRYGFDAGRLVRVISVDRTVGGRAGKAGFFA